MQVNKVQFISSASQGLSTTFDILARPRIHLGPRIHTQSPALVQKFKICRSQ
ncbi:hypothetical protein OIU77_009853 [Salix suchowensis]|uniref:Uncharacterized protein n=2 Tax=Salix TaxID=40685 RepID=A0A9Q0Z5L4_9ROSI|nr:hypothetical protein OIU77_009853 [Salix suchowensis]KAJ6722339.1 hypothetical protein OIU74_007031 [Salix koriyanagi]